MAADWRTSARKRWRANVANTYTQAGGQHRLEQRSGNRKTMRMLSTDPYEEILTATSSSMISVNCLSMLGLSRQNECGAHGRPLIRSVVGEEEIVEEAKWRNSEG